MVKCKYEGTGIWDGRCIGTNEVDPCPAYGKCKQYKPNYTTNADRIRAMSDEELAEFLGDWAQRHRAWMCDSQGECLAWLQEPAKDGGNDD